jgi:hypothetical protein
MIKISSLLTLGALLAISGAASACDCAQGKAMSAKTDAKTTKVVAAKPVAAKVVQTTSTKAAGCANCVKAANSGVSTLANAKVAAKPVSAGCPACVKAATAKKAAAKS